MIPYVLLAAFALVCAYTGTVVLAILIAASRRAKEEITDAAAARVRPEIDKALIAYVAGRTDLGEIERYFKSHPRTLEAALLATQGALSGDSRDRLLNLTIDLQLLQRWCKEARSSNLTKRRIALSRLAAVSVHAPARSLAGDVLLDALEDPDGEARLEAARSLIHTGEMDVVSEVFRLATTQPLIVRAILADDLRHYAIELCETAVPEALRSDRPERVRATLEILAAWERALPLTGLAPLAESKDLKLRVLALKVLPLAPATRDGADAVLRALVDENEDVAMAAAGAAARMKLENAMVPLARCLRQGRVNLSRAAAAALSALPPRGWETLEELSRYPNPITASASMEALERARKTALGI